jgi:UPF0716 protein FxsA
LAAIGVRGLRRRMPLITDATLFGADPQATRRGYSGDGRDYIDGEVVDVRDFEPPALPNERRGGFPGQPGWD